VTGGRLWPRLYGEAGLDNLPAVDRERARANIRAGMVASCLALLVFALAFYVAIIYLR
jgi:hypothetical protein